MRRKRKVLIVEDEIFTSMMICEYLNNHGYSTQPVTTGEAAIIKADEMKPDIIFMDIRLAGSMNGIESAKTITAKKDIPIVFMTGYSSDEVIEETRALKSAAFLSKPLQVEEIDSLIKSVLRL